MNIQTIKDWFEKNKKYENDEPSVEENNFCLFIEFKELKNWDVSSPHDERSINIGKVNGRFFWYETKDYRIYENTFGYIDEIE